MSEYCALLSTNGGCDWCGKTLTGRRTRWCSRRCSREYVANHRWTQAKAMAKKRVMTYRCERCGTHTDTVEVNHIEPCLGKHGIWGCHHHQSNLEVLCVPCHRETTATQRAAGQLRKGK